MGEHSSSDIEVVISRNRLEFLVDGIFAIAMTILVLEIKVPEIADRKSSSELWTALMHHGAMFFSYLVSFAMLGIFWYSHHLYYRFVRQVTKSMLALHLIMLATAAFFPFCAAVLGRYTTNPTTMVLYVGCILVYMACITALWILGEKQNILDPGLDRNTIRRYRRGYMRGSIAILAYLFFFIARACL